MKVKTVVNGDIDSNAVDVNSSAAAANTLAETATTTSVNTANVSATAGTASANGTGDQREMIVSEEVESTVIVSGRPRCVCAHYGSW